MLLYKIVLDKKIEALPIVSAKAQLVQCPIIRRTARWRLLRSFIIATDTGNRF